eukprot:1153246-Pelagomonas_calceolata.AAC.5
MRGRGDLGGQGGEVRQWGWAVELRVLHVGSGWSRGLCWRQCAHEGASWLGQGMHQRVPTHDYVVIAGQGRSMCMPARLSLGGLCSLG